MTFLLFILILSILIVVHEAGHFFMARKLGVKVEQFALGFGPKIWSYKSGDTEYCLCAVPLGGYVKMAGDERSQCKGNSDEYFSKSPGHRALIVLMGPVVNYVLAFLCFSVVFMIGFVDLEASNKRVPATVGGIVAGSPAQQSGLIIGDQIKAVDGISAENWVEMQDMIATSKGDSIEIVVLRDGQVQNLSVIPESHMIKDLFGKNQRINRIGIQPAVISSKDDLVIKRYGFWQSWGAGAHELWSITIKTYQALGEIITGRRSPKEGMTGLIGIFMIIKFAASIGFGFLLHVVGVISASLAIFNLIPIIPLDGGHMAYLGLEKLRGKCLSVRTEDIIAKIGFVLIISLAVYVFYLDFERIGLIERIISLFHRG